MPYEWTPAAERSLQSAAMRVGGEASAAVDAVCLLLGLVAQEECRAAAMLAKRGITLGGVSARWPRRTSPAAAAKHGGADRLHEMTRELQHALSLAVGRLHELPAPLATEHLLMALVLGEDEVAAWLGEHGISADALEQDIYAIYNVTPGPIEMDELTSASAAPQPRCTSPARPTETAAHGAFHLPPSETHAILRIVDAAANRAGEGLRVIEDYLRFALDDAHLTGVCKQLRHALFEALSPLALAQRLRARETQVDVGTAIETAQEYDRRDLNQVVTANFARVEQSLRSLEEYTKLACPEAARALEQLRYRTYTLQRATHTTAASAERLAAARLYVLLDGCGSPALFRQKASEIVAAGAQLVQLRDKRLGDAELLVRGQSLREITSGTDTLFIMNDRPDLALLTDADGVHVGQEELPVHEVRKIVGLGLLVGVSTHTIEQARAAVLAGADYLGVGPTFPSQTKDFAEMAGLEFVREVAAEIRLPAFAIGGITPDNVAQVLAAGLSRVAVGGAIQHCTSPADAVHRLLQQTAAQPG